MNFRISGFLLVIFCMTLISCNSKQKDNSEQYPADVQDEDVANIDNQNTNSDILSPSDNQNTNGSTITEVFLTEEDENGNVFIKDENGNTIILGKDSKAQFSMKE